MATETRTIRDDHELAAYLLAMRTAFHTGPLGPDAITPEMLDWARPRVDLDRTWASFDNGRLCGTAHTFPTALRLPGGAAVVASALTQVTVLPTHTRRGHLRQMMRAQLEAAISAREPLSILLASQWPIYGRFGYGPAADAAAWTVDLRRAHVAAESSGSIELVDAVDLRKVVEEIWREHHARTPGAIDRDPLWWDSITGVSPRPSEEPKPNRCRVVHRSSEGRPDGYAIYDPKEGEWQGFVADNTLGVVEAVGATVEAERELWRYLCDIELTATLTVHNSPALPLRYWLTDGRTAQQTSRWDHLWVRLLDIPAALSARQYPVAGSVVFEAVDPFLDGGGRFRLDVGDDGAGRCEPTTDEPDVIGSVAAFGAAYLGGTRLSDLAPGGMVSERTPGGLARATVLLSWPVVPYCSSDF